MEQYPAPTYFCDWDKHGKCNDSPLCIANGGSCLATTCVCYALRNHKGEPVKRMFSRDLEETADED